MSETVKSPQRHISHPRRQRQHTHRSERHYRSPTTDHSEERPLPTIPTSIPPNAPLRGDDVLTVVSEGSYADSGFSSYGQGRLPGDSKTGDTSFVGGFAVGLKKALLGLRGGHKERLPVHSEEKIAGNPNAVFQEEARVLPVNTTDNALSPIEYVTPPPVSETLHGNPETLDLHDGETTAVHHEYLPHTPHIGSPVLVEPQPGPDYAKMDSPTPPVSETSFKTYLSRTQQFFRTLNDLPWVADRVTVDYYPGQSTRRVRPRPTHRPVMSWYNGEPSGHSHQVVNLSGSSSPSTNHLSHPSDGIPENVPPPPGAPRYPDGYVGYNQQHLGQAVYASQMSQLTNPTIIQQPVTQHAGTAGQYPYPVSHMHPA